MKRVRILESFEFEALPYEALIYDDSDDSVEFIAAFRNKEDAQIFCIRYGMMHGMPVEDVSRWVSKTDC